jgi:hypothetical protein
MKHTNGRGDGCMTIRTPWFEIRILSRRSAIRDEYQRNGKLAAVGLARRWLRLSPSAALEYVNKLEMKQRGQR